jgi:hypothetical protein
MFALRVVSTLSASGDRKQEKMATVTSSGHDALIVWKDLSKSFAHCRFHTYI